MPSNSVEVANAVVELLTDTFDDTDIEVSRQWKKRNNLGTIEGRKVDVFPTSMADEGPASRKQNFYDVAISVVCIERYINEDDPQVTDVWIDERVLFVEEEIFNILSDGRLRLQTTNGVYWPDKAEITVLCSMSYLDENNIFWSEVEVTYRKIANSPLIGS